jgi:hypothetical protein
MRFPAAAAVLVLCALGCDAGLEPELPSTACPSGICGVVHFLGAVPESTDYVRVAVYQTVPDSLDQLLSFAGFSDPLPLGPDSAIYRCCITPLAPGTYAWVLVVWKQLGPLDATSAPALLRVAGSYFDPADTTRLGAVTVAAAGGTGSIDIVADFGKMRSLSDFVPPPAP